MKRILIVAPIALLIFASCLVLKKRYMGGYRIFKSGKSMDIVHSPTTMQRNSKLIYTYPIPEVSLYAFHKNEFMMKNLMSINIKSEPGYINSIQTKDNLN